MKLRAGGPLAIALALLLPRPALAEGEDISPEAKALIELTRTTQAEYSLYAWNVITPPDMPAREEWSAEFNSGRYHRVETPRDRLVADCEAHTGWYLNLVDGSLTDGPDVAAVACGVSDEAAIIAAQVSGTVQTLGGPARHLVVTDSEHVRTYDVLASGALANSTISTLTGERLLDCRAQFIDPTAPGDIFSLESLRQSAVPEKYRVSLTAKL